MIGRPTPHSCRSVSTVVSLIAAAIVIASVATGPHAWAADGTTVPHGGYSAATDACLQCHDIHEAAADYVLMRRPTVTATCATCHTIYLVAPTGAYDPGYPGAESGTAADARAYLTSEASATIHGGHRLGLGGGSYLFADGATGDGSYIPGGTDGLSAIRHLAYPQSDPSLTFEATAGLYCASCHTPHGAFGSMVPLAVSTALLSARPNHSAEVSVSAWATDGGLWCGGCHDARLPGGPDAQHAGYALGDCVSGACHSRIATDFPHTGTAELLP